MTANRYGLDRNIPVGVKKAVRRRCGFGCVICGDAIITYEHIEPLFVNAKAHDPTCITLLCANHQLQSTKGLLSKETIKRANNDPFCKREGRAKHLFDLGGERPNLLIGKNNFTECGHVIRVDGRTFFQVLAPDRKSSLWRLSATFQDKSGATVCKILENELVLNSASYDIEQTAARFSISCKNEIILEIEVLPPTSLLLKTYRIITKNGTVSIGKFQIPGPFANSSTDFGQNNEQDAVIFEPNQGGKMIFVACSFVSPDGLNFGFSNGGLQIGPVPLVPPSDCASRRR